MSTTTSPLDDEPTGFFDFMLNEPLRFPSGPFGWNEVNPSAIADEPEFHHHHHNYAEIVGKQTPASHAFQTVRLIDEYPQDFEAVAAEIKPEAWRLLFYANAYSLEMLGHFRFHPDQELIRLSNPSGDGVDIPRDFIGAEDSPRAVATQVHHLLFEQGPEFAKAAWAILSLAQKLNLSKAEVLKCQWWSPLWIRALNSRLNSGS